jgi:hypothetical protein
MIKKSGNCTDILTYSDLIKITHTVCSLELGDIIFQKKHPIQRFSVDYVVET